VGGPEECLVLPSTASDFIRKVVFASGSPFPIFPAHRLDAPGGLDPLILVDGGYSNNVPVDAALTVGAEQVLILRSSPLPAPNASEVEGPGTPLLGPLAGSLDRLLAYLFERSQSVDRLSSNDLFVVSLSPSARPEHWPPLFDFRRTTVQRMLREAESDLGRRIGRVESWGLPHFRIVFQVAADR
jgi:predicted acylesterase/phospholipase RssA